MTNWLTKGATAKSLGVCVNTFDKVYMMHRDFPYPSLAGLYKASEVAEFDRLFNRVSPLVRKRTRDNKLINLRGSDAQSPEPAPSRQVSC
jgi:hypothetical protein